MVLSLIGNIAGVVLYECFPLMIWWRLPGFVQQDLQNVSRETATELIENMLEVEIETSIDHREQFDLKNKFKKLDSEIDINSEIKTHVETNAFRVDFRPKISNSVVFFGGCIFFVCFSIAAVVCEFM